MNAGKIPVPTGSTPTQAVKRRKMSAMQLHRWNERSWAHGAMLLAVVVSAASCGGSSYSGASAQAPTVAVSAPANFASGITGTLTFSANATSYAGMATVEFQVDGVAAGAAQTSAPYSVSVDTNAYASGQHVLRVRASDAAGNQSAWASVTVSFGGSRTQPVGFTRNTTYITGLTLATAFAQAPDGRIFVSQQGGAMRVVKSNALLATPFMTLPVDSNGERGLLGVAFHPNFASNNLIYVYYTATTPTTHNRISQFTANGDVAMAGSEVVIADLPDLGATNHNGGGMHFGADGKLYVSVGENATPTNSQTLANVLGKLLRFNADGTIPSDNPFFNTATGQARAIWALGLRNPFTFAVQPGTGRIHINDVGEGTWEEINVGVAGANYGWPITEGPTTMAGITGPLFAYGHMATNPPGSGPGGFFTGCAIIGGAFYPDSPPFPAAYRGSYFFSDLCSAFVARLDLVNNAAYSFGAVPGNPRGMLVANDGALLVLTSDSIVRFTSP
jgi:glucose/arabinose dehydrogenase